MAPRKPVGKLLLFGATGDLAQRMLLPSLYGLHADGLLPDGLTITGTARADNDDDSYRAFTKAALDKFVPKDRIDEKAVSSFLERLGYQSLDATDLDHYKQLAEKVGDVSGGLAIFLSTAPSLFEAVIRGLDSAGLAGDTVRIGLEKPLGYDLASSREINDTVATAFSEERTFRIDHYLGKETVQNILALRFGNSFFEPVWNARGIDNVQITISETVGLCVTWSPTTCSSCSRSSRWNPLPASTATPSVTKRRRCSGRSARSSPKTRRGTR